MKESHKVRKSKVIHLFAPKEPAKVKTDFPKVSKSVSKTYDSSDNENEENQGTPQVHCGKVVGSSGFDQQVVAVE